MELNISNEEKIIIDEITDFFNKLAKGKNYIIFPEELIDKLTEHHAVIIRDYLDTVQLFRLHNSEIKFFEWLKENDIEVWNDLWKLDNPVDEDINDEDVNDGFEVVNDKVEDKVDYLVSKIFLPVILKKDGRGFPICDLVTTDNYYFTPHQLPDDESKIFVESSKERFLKKEVLTTAQLLAIEISMGDIDIWHFAYKHKIELPKAKKAVWDMVEDGILVHLKESEHLIPFLNFR